MDLDPKLAAIIGGVDFDPESLRARYRLERDKRLRKDGNEQYVKVTAEFSRYVDDPYVEPGFMRDPIHDEFDVLVIGGGFGGILAGARLREAGVTSVRIIDKAGGFGGTWYWNRYPGAGCDTESYVYFPLLEETGYMPTRKYAFAPEILEYARYMARHFGLVEGAIFQTSVTGMQWDEASLRWIVTTDRRDRLRARFVVLSCGSLSRPKLPGIPGINEFRGYTFHTSRWDYEYTGGGSDGGLTKLADKRVGLIGTGATSIQCVPYLAESAKQLYVFQRTPSSIDARNNCETDPEWVKTLKPGWHQERMENFTTIIHGGEAEVDLVADGWTEIFRSMTSSAIRQQAERLGRPITRPERDLLVELADHKKMERLRARVDAIVKDRATAEALKPWYRLFCKRPCMHDSYLQTFNLPNVRLVDTDGRGVDRLTRNAAVVDDVEYPLDCLIFATGFEVGTDYAGRAGMKILGRDGVNLSDAWRMGMRTLHGLQTHGFPNMFVMGFTQTAFSFVLTHALDEQARHLSYIIGETRGRGLRSVETSLEAQDAWCAEMRAKARLGAEFYRECTPGWYNSEGRIDNPHGFYVGMYGGGPMKFFQILKDWRDAGDLPGVIVR